jgi:O-antigen ligase
VLARAPKAGGDVTRALEPLVLLWLLAAIAAALSARSLWAVFHGLDLRVVNGKGMTDAEALAGNLDSLASVFAGIVLYRVLRVLEPDSSRRALTGAVAGASLSCAVAGLQALGWIAAPRSAFWRTAARFQGLSSDPNALGVLAGLAIPVALAGALWGSRRPAAWVAVFVLAAGLSESGSRSGFLVALGGAGIVVAAALRRRDPGARPAARPGRRLWIVGAAALAAALLIADRRAGGLSQRLFSIFDRGVPFQFRASARPALWKGAWNVWRANPVSGVGWNAFSWQMPNHSPAAAAMPGYDNPGNFYLQVLAETGLAGVVIFFIFLAAAAATIARSLREERRRSPRPAGLPGPAAALAAFAVALLFGSHLLAAEVSCFAFVLLAQFRSEGTPFKAMGVGPRIALAAAVLAWAVALAQTARPSEAFRYANRIGFFAPESSSAGEFRWAGRRSAIRLPAGGRERLDLVFRSPSAEPDRLRISSGARTFFEKPLERDRTIRLNLIAPAGRPAVWIVENSRSFRPSAISPSRDSRDLSIQAFTEP